MASATSVRLDNVIVSYPNILTPRQGQDKYSAAFLISKSDQQTLDAVDAAIQAAQQLGKEKWPKKNFKDTTLHDGADKYPDDEEYHDYMILNTSAKTAPTVIRKNGTVLTPENQDEVFAGLLVYAKVNFYPYEYEKTKTGISCGLNGLMITEQEGPLGRLDGRSSVSEMFGDLIQADDEDQDEMLQNEFNGAL